MARFFLTFFINFFVCFSWFSMLVLECVAVACCSPVSQSHPFLLVVDRFFVSGSRSSLEFSRFFFCWLVGCQICWQVFFLGLSTALVSRCGLVPWIFLGGSFFLVSFFFLFSSLVGWLVGWVSGVGRREVFGGGRPFASSSSSSSFFFFFFFS